MAIPDCKGFMEVAGHGRRLAEDAIGARVEDAVEEPVVAGKCCKRGGGGTILTDEDSNGEAKEGAKQQHQKVEMEHAGQNDPRAEFAEETEQRESG
jgi:hypothetical protein